MKVGDLVIWKTDGDIGVITETLPEFDQVYVEWANEPHKSGLHSKQHEHLEVVNESR